MWVPESEPEGSRQTKEWKSAKSSAGRADAWVWSLPCTWTLSLEAQELARRQEQTSEALSSHPRIL